ncbi:alpha/beta fold hydrolase [Actinokineospora sp. NBRC 105648]|uniref:alpha/beta fold hydrolase n=1 Tax=Actinokineospora sp. NBRC 105648 TaxID=3032206 RepID=UPI0024A1BE47|nr:alpha/beta fold hydrolase [Actinokineospora sp. NBRC 105648]GLZ40110.1 alpha/beta hydrolase [Actinokineospora sp. NBRC 105648]
MTTFVLLHGAGSDARYWDLVIPHLRGHEVIAPNLPVADEDAGLAEYARAVIDAVGGRGGDGLPDADADTGQGGGGRVGGGGQDGAGVDAPGSAGRDRTVLVAQSMAGFTAPLVARELSADLIILVNAMVPKPGETPGDWWAATGQPAAARALAVAQGRDPDAPFDPVEIFLHDLPEDLVRELMSEGPPGQADKPFGEPWPLDAWPDVRTEAVVSTGDRLFPADFQHRVLADRLGITAVEIDTGHLPAFARPAALAALLESFLAD